jgi:hypothetical protein
MDQDERCRVSQMTADPWWKPRIGEWSEMAMLVDRSVELSLDCVLNGDDHRGVCGAGDSWEGCPPSGLSLV